ncbi:MULTISPECIES: VOC family protein [unclassified Brevibacterium]|uniref:VOC family protein n=1 Tax=unclassified Brevibacterium TaxID=2614124 RepID=UPI0010933165|nr:VOC family protein [Brevibacterium sp. S22]TGD30987.1 glyoxalase [Brevibacterium sp. S22]
MSAESANAQSCSVWPTFRYRDAKAAIAFLQEALGFEVIAEYTNADNPDRVDHAELAWPEGGGVMLGSVRDDGGVMTRTGVASGSVYLASGNVRELHSRALAAGAAEVMGLTEQDYGSLDFSIQDPEGVLWSVGTYCGAST